MTTGKASDKRFVPSDASSFSHALPERKLDSSSETQDESQATAFEKVLLEMAQQTGKAVEKAKPSERKPKIRRTAAHEPEPVLSSEQIEDLIYKARGEIPTAVKSQGGSVHSLNLQFIPFSWQKVQELVKAFPNLRELNLKNCDLDDEALEVISKLKRLQSLNISHSKRVTDVGLFFLTDCKNLTALDISGLKAVGESVAFLAELRSLKSVKINGCSLFLESKWLESFLQKEPDDSYVDHIVFLYKEAIREAKKPLKEPLLTLEKVIDRYESFEDLGLERWPLEAYELLHLAYFIEAKIPQMEKKTAYLFSQKKYGLPRTMLLQEGKVYIRAKHAFSVISGEGTYKKVASAAELALEKISEPIRSVAWATTKIKTAHGHIVGIKQHVADLKEALLCRDKLKGLHGIAQTFTFYNYNKRVPVQSGEQLVNRLCIISELYDGSVYDIIKQGTELDLESMLFLISDVSRGLQALHKLNYIHGDFKPANCLYYIDPETLSIYAAVTDFGYVFNPDRDKPPSIFVVGFYGTALYTAPELFGVNNFKCDFKKLDVFAFGCMLYELYFGERPPWMDIIGNCAHKREYLNAAKLKVAQAQVNSLIDEYVEEPFEELLEKESLTFSDQIEKLIYECLRLDPKERFDMAEVERAVIEIKEEEE